MELVQLVNQKKNEREQLIKKVSAPIAGKLAENNIKAEIQGRAKHFYSIYHKMKTQEKTFDEIYDLLALRIIVEKKSECYAALGLVHSLFTYLQDRFKDYIATPKNNGYRSLHTTVVALDQMVEIQIRTKEMHIEAEEGIAAHWNYKEGKITGDNDQYILWVRKILQQRNEDSNPENFMDNLKADLYQDEVFVYSPKGHLFKLPQDATALDFAFEIHSNLGLKTIGAKVNGRIVPLKHKLNNGEVVEIITTKSPVVNRDWLDIVKTSKARHAIRKWLKEKEFEDSATLGREMLGNELKKAGLKISEEELNELAVKMGYQETKSFFAAIGHDDLNPKTVINKFSPAHNQEDRNLLDQGLLKQFFTRVRRDISLKVEGMDNMMITFAKCCQPVPGDKIIGYVTRGRGVTIHRHDCKNIVHLINNSPKEKIVSADWGYKKSRNFPVQLIIKAIDRTGLLQDLTNAISRVKETGLLMVNIRATDGMVTGHMMVEVNNLDHLNKVLKNMRKVDKVISVERFNGQQYPI
jgi:GTP pyrophosphokinase